MNPEDIDVNDLETSIELWLLSDEKDFEETFGEDMTQAIKEELEYD